MKVWKWHTLVFRCPTCGKDAEYAAQIIEGPDQGTLLDPSYWCEKCHSTVHATDRWLFGAVFGPLMAIVGTIAIQALPSGLQGVHWVAFPFAALCCGIVGWPLSRALSRHLVYWEPRDPSAQRLSRLRRLREDDE